MASKWPNYITSWHVLIHDSITYQLSIHTHQIIPGFLNYQLFLFIYYFWVQNICKCFSNLLKQDAIISIRWFELRQSKQSPNWISVGYFSPLVYIWRLIKRSTESNTYLTELTKSFTGRKQLVGASLKGILV